MIEQTLEPSETKVPAFTAVAATTGVTAWGYQTEVSTGIADVKADNSANGPVYDLQGRRVSTLRLNGVYIRNGKKFIVK